MAPFLPALVSAHRQPLTAVRRGFQLLGFLLKCCNTSFLRAQLYLEVREKRETSSIKSSSFGESGFSPFSAWTQDSDRSCRDTARCIPARLIQTVLCVDPVRVLCHSQGHEQGVRSSVHPMIILAFHPHCAAAISLHLKFWTRQRGNGLSPQGMEAAARTRSPLTH